MGEGDSEESINREQQVGRSREMGMSQVKVAWVEYEGAVGLF